MGRTALALARLLVREGAAPFISELKGAAACGEIPAALDGLGVAWECGGHTERALAGSALVVPSPGVPPASPLLQDARAAGISVTGEMELAWRFTNARILAVTGTNGKTTTTELVRALIAACGHTVLLAGNNDTPLSAAVMAEPAPAYIVLEVSSFQLELAATFRPWSAALLNVTPDHLAWHGGMEGYIAAKRRMFAKQTSGDTAVLNDDDAIAASMDVPPEASVWRFSLERPQDRGLWVRGDAIFHGGDLVARTADTPLPGRHNLQNVLAALCMMRAGGFAWDRVLAGLREFKGVEHRIEFVAEQDGVAFYNDSKSTNIDSLKVALESFDRPVVLVAGGGAKAPITACCGRWSRVTSRRSSRWERTLRFSRRRLAISRRRAGPPACARPLRRRGMPRRRVTWCFCRPRAPVLTCSTILSIGGGSSRRACRNS